MPDIRINRTSGQAVRCATEGLMKPDPNQGIDILANTRATTLAPPTIKLSVEPEISTDLWACLRETFRFADPILFPFPENLYQLFTDRTVLMLCQDLDVLIYAPRNRNRLIFFSVHLREYRMVRDTTQVLSLPPNSAQGQCHIYWEP